MQGEQKHHLAQEDGLPIATSDVKRIRGGGTPNEDELYNNDDNLYNEQDFEDDDAAAAAEMEYHDEGSNLSWSDANIKDSAIKFDNLSPEQLKRWARPPVPDDVLDSSAADLHLQWLDIDMVNGTPLSSNPNSQKKSVVGAQEGEVPVIRVYGVTDAGNSAVVFIHGYTPYGYFALPEGHELAYQNEDEKNSKLTKIREILNARLKIAKARRNQKRGDENADLVHGVQYIEDCKSIMGYNSSHTRFLKVYLQMPTLVPALKRIMEEGMTLPGITPKEGFQSRNTWDESANTSYQPFECNVPFVLRFMIDEKITGAGWLTLPKGTYQHHMKGRKLTNCQVSQDWLISLYSQT
jgi:DNA polymerase delta subunit 1